MNITTIDEMADFLVRLLPRSAVEQAVLRLSREESEIPLTSRQQQIGRLLLPKLKTIQGARSTEEKSVRLKRICSEVSDILETCDSENYNSISDLVLRIEKEVRSNLGERPRVEAMVKHWWRLGEVAEYLFWGRE